MLYEMSSLKIIFLEVELLCKKKWYNYYRYVAGATGGGIGTIVGVAVLSGAFINSVCTTALTAKLSISATCSISNLAMNNMNSAERQSIVK